MNRRHEAAAIISLQNDRDRLAVENAELRKQCAAFHAEANDHYRATLAANATLDALRDLCGPNRTISNSTCMKMVGILYPQPKEMTDEEQ